MLSVTGTLNDNEVEFDEQPFVVKEKASVLVTFIDELAVNEEAASPSHNSRQGLKRSDFHFDEIAARFQRSGVNSLSDEVIKERRSQL